MMPPDDQAWDPWTPSRLAERLREVTVEWYVVGGWALDLWRGRQSRPHADLEFATTPAAAPAIASRLSDLAFFDARDGELHPADPTGTIPEDAWQFWGADADAGRWRVDMMIERGTATRWRYKRHPDLTLPRLRAIRASAAGLRYLAPALVLLFKAKACRPKDQADFDAALPHLSPQDRRDLTNWLALCHPGHHWAARLTD